MRALIGLSTVLYESTKHGKTKAHAIILKNGGKVSEFFFWN